jgi:hypothetical protein
MIYFIDSILLVRPFSMARPQIHPVYAAACGLIAFALIEATLVPLSGMARVSYQAGDKVNLYAILTAMADWSACITCVLVGMKLSRSKPIVIATFLALVLAVWHLAMIFAMFNFAQVLGDAIVPDSIIYYGGLLVTGAVLVLCYERRTLKGSQANRRALAELSKPSVYGQALTTAGLDNALAQAINAKAANRLPRMVELTEAEERSASFFDLDLILLEDELLKIKPDRSAYIAALRLGIAIEKDLGFVNCRARTFTFAELMRDVCTRLSVSLGGENEWLTLAEGFRYYGEEDRLERRLKIAAYEDYLIAVPFNTSVAETEGVTGEEPEGHLDSTDSGTKILAVIK